MNNGLNKGNFGNSQIGINSGLFGNGVIFQNPILIAQPTVWITGAERGFINSGSPTDQGDITRIDNYINKSIAWTPINVTSRAIWERLKGTTNPILNWEGNVATNGALSGGTTTTLNFCNQSTTCAFTLYFVHIPNKNENTGTTKMPFCTAQTTGERGIQFAIFGSGASGSSRFVRLNILNNTAGQVALTIQNEYKSNESHPRLISIRVNAIGKSIGQIAAWIYRNGFETDSAAISFNLVANGTSFRVPHIGNRPGQDIRCGTGIGDLIIFRGMHDLKTHKNICNYLIKKWNIV